MNSRAVVIKNAHGDKTDVVYHFNLESARRREAPHGKIANGETAQVLDECQEWLKLWHAYKEVYVRRAHCRAVAAEPAEAEPAEAEPAREESVWSMLGQPHLEQDYAAAASFIIDRPSRALDWADQRWSLGPMSGVRKCRTCLLRVHPEDAASWAARSRRLARLAAACPMDERDSDIAAGRAKWRRLCTGERGVMLTWRCCGGSEGDISTTCRGPQLWTTADGGFFGNGHYTAVDPAYALLRARDAGILPNGSGEKAMVLFAVAAANVRIITRRGDYRPGAAFSDYYSSDYYIRRAMLPGVDTYFVPVSDRQACSAHAAEAFEVVVADDAQLLPLAVVYYVEQ
jgi:hypothetical protein